mgnify:CR=1 FL=1
MTNSNYLFIVLPRQLCTLNIDKQTGRYPFANNTLKCTHPDLLNKLNSVFLQQLR